MWNKLYTIAAASFFVLMSVLSYLAYSWLQSVDKPASVLAKYDYYAGIASTCLWISTVVLLVLANVVLWKTGKAWALWATFLYFAIFILAQTFWLDNALFAYKQQNAPAVGGSFSTSVFLGVILCALAAAIVFFNQFLVTRFRGKMLTAEPPAEQISHESAVQPTSVESAVEDKEVL